MLVSSGLAVADWEQGFANGQTSTVYFDPFSLHKEGDRVRASVLSDLKSPDTVDGKPYLSVRSIKEYDCNSGMIRTVEISLYTGPMATGDIVARRIPGMNEWRALTQKATWPQKLARKVWALACGSR